MLISPKYKAAASGLGWAGPAGIVGPAGPAAAWYFAEISVPWPVDINATWSVDITGELEQLSLN